MAKRYCMCGGVGVRLGLGVDGWGYVVQFAVCVGRGFSPAGPRALCAIMQRTLMTQQPRSPARGWALQSVRAASSDTPAPTAQADGERSSLLSRLKAVKCPEECVPVSALAAAVLSLFCCWRLDCGTVREDPHSSAHLKCACSPLVPNKDKSHCVSY